MSSTENNLYDSISNAFIQAINKVNSENISLSDMYVCVRYDDLSLTIYDDLENVLIQTTIDEWDTLKDESVDFEQEVASSLKKILNSQIMNKEFETMDLIGPFSVLLVNEDKDQLEELFIMEKDTIFLNDELLKNMDKELDDFFEKLMSDVK